MQEVVNKVLTVLDTLLSDQQLLYGLLIGPENKELLSELKKNSHGLMLDIVYPGDTGLKLQELKKDRVIADFAMVEDTEGLELITDNRDRLGPNRFVLAYGDFENKDFDYALNAGAELIDKFEDITVLIFNTKNQ